MVGNESKSERPVIGAVDDQVPIILNGHITDKPAESHKKDTVKIMLPAKPGISAESVVPVQPRPTVQIIAQNIPKLEDLILNGKVNAKPGEVIYLWGKGYGQERYVRVAGFSESCGFDKVVLSFENPLHVGTELGEARVNLVRGDRTFRLNCLHGYEMIKFSLEKGDNVGNMIEKVSFGDLVALHRSTRYGDVCGFVVNYNSESMVLSHQDPFCGATGQGSIGHYVEQIRGLKNITYRLSKFSKLEILRTRKNFDEELKKKEDPKTEEKK